MSSVSCDALISWISVDVSFRLWWTRFFLPWLYILLSFLVKGSESLTVKAG